VRVSRSASTSRLRRERKYQPLVARHSGPTTRRSRSARPRTCGAPRPDRLATTSPSPTLVRPTFAVSKLAAARASRSLSRATAGGRALPRLRALRRTALDERLLGSFLRSLACRAARSTCCRDREGATSRPSSGTCGRTARPLPRRATDARRASSRRSSARVARLALVRSGSSSPRGAAREDGSSGSRRPRARRSSSGCAHADFTTYLPDDILVKVDVAPWRSGSRRAPPLLDHGSRSRRQLPSASKMEGGCARSRHEARASRRRLPSTTLERRKMGSAFPLDHWSAARSRRSRGDALSRRALERGIPRREGRASAPRRAPEQALRRHTCFQPSSCSSSGTGLDRRAGRPDGRSEGGRRILVTTSTRRGFSRRRHGALARQLAERSPPRVVGVIVVTTFRPARSWLGMPLVEPASRRPDLPRAVLRVVE